MQVGQRTAGPDSFCNGFQCPNEVALLAHRLLNGVVRVTVVVCFIEELAPLSQTAYEGFPLAIVIKVNRDMTQA